MSSIHTSENAQTEPHTPSVVFSWFGLPQYAALLLKEAMTTLGRQCLVLGSQPSVPIKGMEHTLGDALQWIDPSKPLTWADLGRSVPEIFVQSGWRYPAFASLGMEVKQRGGFVIGLSDANWRGDFRQLLLGPILFRLVFRRRFDAMIVPGRQGTRLMTYFGIPQDRIRTGMYGADPAVFRGGGPVSRREKIFLFVGQFIARKDVLTLAKAFLRFADDHPGWTLKLCGSGPQRDLLPRDRRIQIEEFVQPSDLAEHYRSARFFVLPSLVEAWGLVVHEAALCGCPLVLSDQIGSADDLATPLNSVRFKAGSEDDLLRALREAAEFDDQRLEVAEATSRAKAEDFGPARFASEVHQLVSQFQASHVEN